ncbi:MAG: hypothetical protein N3F64_03740 [Nitrososphaeria archaeon]|nr:hypothetical protein [Nitrososphaeria archaeon]
MMKKSVNRIAAATLIVILLASTLALIGAGVVYAKSDKAEEMKQRVKNVQEQIKEMNNMRFERLKKMFNERRLVMINKGPNYVNFISTKTEEGVQSFILKIHVEGTPSIYVSLANYTKEDGNKTLYWVNGVLKTFGVIEYIDKNNDGLYIQKDNDTRLQYINFARLSWKLTVKEIEKDNVRGWKVQMIANDRGATYNITTQVFNTGVRLEDGTPVAPYEAKIDFSFENFPWSSPESRLALITSFKGVSGSASVTHYKNTTEVVMERNAYAYFTWAPTAKVDGEDVDVMVYKRSSRSDMTNYTEFNYPRGDKIVHDPIIGVLSGSIEDIPAYQLPASVVKPTPVFTGLYLLATTVAVLAVVGVIVVAARKMLVEPKIFKSFH